MQLPSPRSAAAAVAFCASSPDAVVLTVWPSGTNQGPEILKWIEGSGAQIVHSSPVPLTSELAELLTVMALYDGEEWLESNCWYMEQPLPSGPPSGPFAGAQWKRALCFRNAASREPHAVVLDVASATTSLWSSKYSIRAELARLSGNPGNSCIHLTDAQDEAVLDAYRSGGRRRAYGMGCDDSYAYACARALLHPASVAWLNSGAGAGIGRDLGAPAFREAWGRYTSWLHEPRSGAAAADEECFDEAPAFIAAAR